MYLDPSEIGNRLYKIRTLSGYGADGQQKDWADKIGVNPKLYSHWETGRSVIPLLYALFILDKTSGVTLDYIYRGGFDFLTPDAGRRLRETPDRPPTKVGRRPKAAAGRPLPKPSKRRGARRPA